MKLNLSKNIINTIQSFNNLKTVQTELEDAIILCIEALKKNKKIIFCGNGGSAADSQHLSAELVGKFLKKRKAISAISLTSNSSIITSLSNDFSFDIIFERQIQAIANKGDVLFAITTSGTSKNILKAIECASKKKLNTILLTSIKSNIKRKKNLVIIKVPATRVDRIQEMHIAIGHLLCEKIEEFFS